MKTCLYCNGDFEPTRSNRQIYCSKQCRYKHWSLNNRDKLNENVRQYRARRYVKEGRWREDGAKVKALREWMNEIKSQPCIDCGHSYPICCMDFDHRKGTVKTYNVGSMFAHHYSRKLIESELSKCDLVCSNCHRMRTKERRTGSGRYGQHS